MPRPPLIFRIGITGVAIALAVAHVLWPDIKLDSITIALMVIALAPWLQPLFKSIELPGGLKLELQEIKQEVQNIAGAAESAETKADFAISSNESARRAIAIPNKAEAIERLSQLALQYKEIRLQHSSGDTRTAAMTSIVREMIELASSIQDLDVTGMLDSTDEGTRLSAYAYLYACPKPALLSEIVRSVTSVASKPFAQYWGLLAIGRSVDRQMSATIPVKVLVDLKTLLQRVPKGTDREHELKKLIASIENDI
ncbi:MAG: hypothetical protein IPG93_01555 [Burkholderiales bacterium]|nr:hypothetical protein [Burkholderiales bacterium]